MAAVLGALSLVGVNTAHYAGHSFLVGAATTAAHADLSEATIKMLGHWESAAFERYVCTLERALLPYPDSYPGLCELSKDYYF